jgi:hypothetical protein
MAVTGADPVGAGDSAGEAMGAAEALKTARSCGVGLRVDGDHLVLKTSAPPPPFVVDLLRRHKAEIMLLLRPAGDSQSSASTNTDLPDASAAGGTADAFEGRAALGEFDAGIPRAWAEGFAALHQAKPPAWAILRPEAWPDLIKAVGLFLDRWGAQAAQLNWDAINLFGASPRAPLGRVDQQGLVFFLQDGCEIVAMTENTASIRRPSGVTQTFRRPSKNAREPRTAPIWELIG